MTTLYKKDNTGNVRTWEILPDFDQLVITHGRLRGASTTKVTPVRVNQSGRSLDEQIELEMNSRINKQLDRGYCLELEEALSKGMTNALSLPLPMLAQPINKVKKSLETYYCQYKYDGMRCLIHHGKDGLVAYSRGGKPIHTIRHITDTLSIPEGYTVDGELYLHDTSLQTIMSLAKRYQPKSTTLNYMIYDVVLNRAYKERDKIIKKIAADSGPMIKRAPTWKFKSTAMHQVLDEAQGMGYEGLILRDPSAHYEAGKRSQSLLKVKTVEDDIFTILNISRSKDNHAILHCKNFSVLAPGDHVHKEWIWLHADQYIGQQVRVEYANRTKDGVPFHPVATNIVDD